MVLQNFSQKLSQKLSQKSPLCHGALTQPKMRPGSA